MKYTIFIWESVASIIKPAKLNWQFSDWYLIILLHLGLGWIFYLTVAAVN